MTGAVVAARVAAGAAAGAAASAAAVCTLSRTSRGGGGARSGPP